jgi:hypothetical protein
MVVAGRNSLLFGLQNSEIEAPYIGQNWAGPDGPQQRTRQPNRSYNRFTNIYPILSLCTHNSVGSLCAMECVGLGVDPSVLTQDLCVMDAAVCGFINLI